MEDMSDLSAGQSRLTNSEEETFSLAERLASSFSGTEVVLLCGELGAGKTVFAKGLASGCGVTDPGLVTSPSFTLVNIYQGRFPVFHIDLYRLDRAEEIADLGWEDFFGAGVVIVEWGEKMPSLPGALKVDLEIVADGRRRITVSRS